jgi:hypothetical protein
MAAFPELKRLTVEVHKWLTFPQLIHLYSVGQMAPVPNMMIIVAVTVHCRGYTSFKSIELLDRRNSNFCPRVRFVITPEVVP